MEKLIYGNNTEDICYALFAAADSNVTATYDYGPFGEVIRATGPMAKVNPFRFSTKYDDDESDFLYYGYRYYNPSTGRWPNRDPLNEFGFKLLVTGEAVGDDDIDIPNEGNAYLFVKNDPASRNDAFGLWPSASPFFARFLNSGFASKPSGSTSYIQHFVFCGGQIVASRAGVLGIYSLLLKPP